MPTASHSFFISLIYLAAMFIILVLSSSNYIVNGSIISTLFILTLFLETEMLIDIKKSIPMDSST